MKRNPALRYVSRESNLRHYTYTARICKMTGRLLGVRAGCRRWKNFRDALDHYGVHEQAWRRSPVACEKWRNDHGRAILNQAEGWKPYAVWFAERREARELLKKLRRDVQIIQRRIRRRARGH